MEVVGHQAVRVQTPSKAFTGFKEGFLEGGFGSFLVKDRTTVVASIDNMVESIAGLDARFSWHGYMLGPDFQRSI